jgi:short-subunit dehydrogenase
MEPSKPVALVTGASSGIGEAYARKLAAMGYSLILVARRKERLEKLAAELQNAEALRADLSADRDLQAVEDRIESEPQMQFLVNNAGFGVPGSFHESDPDAQDRMHRVHILAIERLTHAALQGMIRRRSGSVVNVSSVAGFVATPYSVGYCASKAWIKSFTEGLYIELKSLGCPVKVQALCPGFTYSEFHDTLGMDRSLIPRSLWMNARDVVNASLRGLERDRWVVVPGWRYRAFLAFYLKFPQSVRHYFSIRYGNSRQKHTR